MNQQQPQLQQQGVVVVQGSNNNNNNNLATKLVTAGSSCCSCCCVCCLLIFCIVLGAERTVLNTYEQSTGTVVAYVEYDEDDRSSTSTTINCLLPQFEFYSELDDTTISGVPNIGDGGTSSICVTQFEFNNGDFDYDIGETVELLYEMEDPENTIRIKDDVLASKRFATFFVIFGVFGTIGCCGLCWFSIFGMNSKNNGAATPAGTTGGIELQQINHPHYAAAAASPATATAAVATVIDIEEAEPAGKGKKIGKVYSNGTTTTTAVATSSMGLPTGVATTQEGQTIPIVGATAYCSLSTYVQKESNAATGDHKFKIIEWMELYPQQIPYLTPQDVNETLSKIVDSGSGMGGGNYQQLPEAAKLIAQFMSNGNENYLTCQHVASAMDSCDDSLYSSTILDIAKAMAPYVNDSAQNKEVVLSKISLSFQKEEVSELFP